MTAQETESLAEKLKTAREKKAVASGKVKASVEPLKGKEVKEMARRWNAVVDALLQAEKEWEGLQELLRSVPRDLVQEGPLQVQKALAKFKRAKFNVMLPRLVEHYRAYGGLKGMKVKEGA